MPDPSIAPPQVGSAAYAADNTRGFVADLYANFHIRPSLAFELRLTAAAAGAEVWLLRDATRLSLLGGDFIDTTTFLDRVVTVGHGTDGDDLVIACSIFPTNFSITEETWSVRARAPSAQTYRLIQIDNSPSFPTVTRLMCDPLAAFTAGGPAHGLEPVELKASPATGTAASPTLVGTPAPAVSYKWTCDSPDLPALPACGDSPTLAFNVPDVPATQDFRFNLEVWFDGQCPSTAGFLHSNAAPQTISIQPAGPKVIVGPETTIPTPHALPFGATYLLDNHKGLVCFWHETDSILAARLDLDNPAAGFSNPPQTVVTGAHLESSVSAAVKPEGPLVLMYASSRLVISNHSFEMVFETEINYKEGAFDQLASAPPHNVIKTDEPLLGLPFVIHYNVLMDAYTAFFYQRRGQWNVQLIKVAFSNDFMSSTVTTTLKGLPVRGNRLHAASEWLGPLLVIAVNSAKDWLDGDTTDEGLAYITSNADVDTPSVLVPLSHKDCAAPFVLLRESQAANDPFKQTWIFWRERGGALFAIGLAASGP
jgi:hypothetical protein